ncbi:mitochondrial 37S ribosomal protein uS5m [Aspergillus homomorphus CBS 101889]|uniref:Small ribosomal subunit protein uS5m n=1 Tax=Aspergillus homomorphus (strain CBS 101889) TaxID=1450537 RepID=A0A395I2U4_ASPHC|nr:hypothetical protein BO97DRAFT_387296 [Aspergillus homomorphus CBS 101889]RAL14026.1 hypothetical protein BO97DRAFT_387296 [Aspergillus homomorphus CBS 101889]
MSLSRPARCVFCNFSRPASAAPRVARRQFHPSPFRLNDAPKPKDSEAPAAPNAKKSAKEGRQMTLNDITRTMRPEFVKRYTEEEKAALQEVYSAKQMEAILAGEEAIDPKDLADQFGVRSDPMRLKYLDDFSHIEPGVDKHVRAPQSNSDYRQQLKSTEELVADFAKYITELPEDADSVHWINFLETNRLTVGKEEAELAPHSALAPDLFQADERLDEGVELSDEEAVVKTESGASAEERLRPRDTLEKFEPPLARLIEFTGLSSKYISNLSVKTLVQHTVTNQTRLGKVQRWYVLAIAGNQNGALGLGEAKSFEASDALKQARYRAVRNMKPILRYENRTIFGDVKGKVGAMDLVLMSRPPGFGLRCQSLIYEMCRAAGISDLAARVNGSRNKMNTVKAAYEALMSQRDPEDVARGRGKKLVDVRKVYYSGKWN